MESGSSIYQGPVVSRALTGIGVRLQPTCSDVLSWDLDTIGKMKVYKPDRKKKSQGKEQSMLVHSNELSANSLGVEGWGWRRA